MADCYALEADDLHRRWLPREIFADLGIVDTDPAAVVAAAAKPDADAATVEELAVQLASILGATAATGGKGKATPPPPPPAAPVAAAPPPPPPAAAAPRKRVRPAVKSNGGGNGAGAGAGAAVAWEPVPPYTLLPLQWQVPTNYVYAGGALTYALLPPPPPCIVPPPPGAKLHGGTGVFLPRAASYRHAPPPAKDVKAPTVKGPSPRAWPGTVKAVQPPQKEEVPAAAGRTSQQRQMVMPQPQVQQKAAAAPVQACPEAAAALPQDWSYH